MSYSKKYTILHLLLFAIALLNSAFAQEMKSNDNETLVKLSQDFLYATKTGKPNAPFIEKLKQLSSDRLILELKSENEKKTFWINIYNAYVQMQLIENAGLYEKRSRFFGNKNIEIGEEKISLALIEHGILRHSKIELSLGYLNKPFPKKFEKKNRVAEVDYRIHFALNCGAASCPAVAFYDPLKLDAQLDLAAEVYLKAECNYDKTTNEVAVPKILSWFRGDFGGKKGIRKILKDLKIIPLLATKTKITFKEYNWDLELKKYLE